MPKKEKAGRVEALILCIDRDDDLGKKAGVRGPVIGERENFRAAQALGVADPEDSDVNAIFAAIKTKREVSHLYKGTEIVTLTGDKEVGVKSDQKIRNQLLRVLDRFKPEGVIVVSDGTEDDKILPLIQSETKILGVNTVTVKLSRPLESAYFRLQDFFKKVGENPHQARVLFGIPGALIFLIVLLSYIGISMVDLILATLGIYLLAKGFGYDEQLFNGLSEVKNSLVRGNIYKVFNLIGVFIIALALITGYLQLQKNLDAIYRPGSLANPRDVGDAFISQPLLSLNFFLFSASGVALTSMDLLLAALVVIAVGFIIHNFLMHEYLKIKRYIYVILLAILIGNMERGIYWFIINLSEGSTTITVEGFDPVQNLMISLLIAFVVLLISHYLLKIVFFDYIEKKRELERAYIGREVVDKTGKRLGSVSKVSVKGGAVVGISIKRRYYPIEEISERGGRLVVEGS